MIDKFRHNLTVWLLELAMKTCKWGDVYDLIYDAYVMEMKSQAWREWK